MITALGNIDDIVERAVRRSLPASVAICAAVRRHVDASRSLELARANPPALSTPLQGFAEVFAQEGLVADLFGRLEVEVHDGGVALQAPALEFSQASAEVAVNWFSKQRIMKREDLARLATAYRRKAKQIAADFRAYVEEKLDESLVKAIRTGITKRDWVKAAAETFDHWGVTRPQPYHLETTFDTTSLAAYNHGRYQQQREPHMLAARPIWQYKTAGDSRVTQFCQQLADHIYPADDPIWNTMYPPNHFRCRSVVISLADGSLSDPPAVGLLPDEGFRTSPADWLK